jgi:hypothetical protein
MASTRHEGKKQKSRPKKRSPVAVAESPLVSQRLLPARTLQRLSFKPDHLTPKDVVQLQQVLGNQQLHDLLRAPSSVQRQEVVQDRDPADVLSPAGLQSWEELDNELRLFRFKLYSAQQANWDAEREQWLQKNLQLSRRLDNVQGDEDIPPIRAAYDALFDKTFDYSIPAGEDWEEVKAAAVEEMARLASGSNFSGVYAYDYLFYSTKKTTHRMSQIDPDVRVEADYRDLKTQMANQEFIWKGELKAARERIRNLFSMLEIVGQLRGKGEDVEEVIPGWSQKIAEERRRLLMLASSAPTYEFQYNFMHLDEGLKLKFDIAMEKSKPEKGVVGKGLDFIKGGITAITDPIIEAGKQAIDITKIVLFTLDELTIDTDWEPELYSDMAKAAEQGADTDDLIIAMGKNIIETPERMWKAIKNDDWEAIGREAVNLYMLAKSGKEGAAKAYSLMKLVKARRLGLMKGMSVDTALKVREIAMREDLTIRFRMVDKPVIRLLQEGHPAKPAMLKMKTIKEIDTYLGASKRDIGKVGFYEPELPSNLLKMSEAEAAAVMKRYNQRLAEYNQYKGEVQSMVERGVIEQQGKVIVDPVTGKAFTGDYDLFDIRRGGKEGPGVELEALKDEIRQTLEEKPVSVQHGAHLDWNEFKAGEIEVFTKIVKEARPAEGNPPMVEVGPDGKIRYTHFED